MQASSKSSTKRTGIPEVPVFEVTKKNVEGILPYLLASINEADFIALDLEMSGLGPKRSQTRYDSFRDAAATRAILSFGIATFKVKLASEKKKRLKYECQVFNILTHPHQPFTVEPDTLKFLLNHRFDFNKLIRDGVLYYPATPDMDCPLRKIFDLILSNQKPLALHNGFLDLCFLYHQLFADLPEELDDFLFFLAELFPKDSPLIDSKYLAKYVSKTKGSYLEYVFRKCQRDNVSEKEKSRAFIDISFSADFSADRESLMGLLDASIERTNCELPPDFPNHSIPPNLTEHLCERFATSGSCGAARREEGCPKLHDLDFALDLIAQKKKEKLKKRNPRIPDDLKEEIEEGSRDGLGMATTPTVTVEELMNSGTRKAFHGSHSAGIDAFMTGFAVLHHNRKYLLKDGKCNPIWANQLILSGKAIPLTISKGVRPMDDEEHRNHFFEIEIARKKKNDQLEKGEQEKEKEFQ